MSQPARCQTCGAREQTGRCAYCGVTPPTLPTREPTPGDGRLDVSVINATGERMFVNARGEIRIVKWL